jgi:hypothetical protein
MAKFMVLYRSASSAQEQMANTTPEQMKAGMDAWMAWAAKAGDAVADLGAPLGATGDAASGGDGISGFSVLQADSAEALAGVLEGHPHLFVPGNTIEVLEFLAMPGM